MAVTDQDKFALQVAGESSSGGPKRLAVDDDGKLRIAVASDWTPKTDDAYWLGSDTKGWKGLKMPGTKLYEIDATTIGLRTIADGGVYLDVAGGGISGGSTDGDSALLKAKDSGGNMVEVARLQGAADPYFQISHLRLNPTATVSLPAVAVEGMLYYDDTDNVLKVHNGTTWVPVGSTGDITFAASTISSAAAILLKPSGDTDDHFTLATVAGIPTITATGADLLHFPSRVTLGVVRDYANTQFISDILVTNPLSGITAASGKSRGAAITGAVDLDNVGLQGEAWIDATNTQNWTGSANLIGVDGFIGIEIGATGTITGAIASKASLSVGAATLTNWYGFYAQNPSGAGTLTNAYGIYIEAMTKGTDLNWGLYNLAASYLGGATTLGAALDANGQGIQNVGHFSGSGGASYYPDETATDNGTHIFYTNNAGAWVNRLTFGANAAVVEATWASITHTGFVLTSGQSIDSAGSIPLKPSGDTDDFFTFATPGNIPTIYGTGAYLRIGDAAATSHSLASEDDLMVSGKLEVDGAAFFDQSNVTFAGDIVMNDDVKLTLGTAGDAMFLWETADSNANHLWLTHPAGGATNVPVFLFAPEASFNSDLGLFDGVTQHTFATIEKSGKYSSASNATSAGAGATMTKASAFTNSLVGDIVRVTAGTNATAGWYWITAVTDADNVDLDRNWCTGAVTGGTFVAYHSFTMLSAEGICTRITDGAPNDSSVEVDRDGWILLDVGQANGRLYWRANNAWHYVDATAGISLPANERIDLQGHKFEVGDEVKFRVDRINEDGSFHALPVFAG